MAAVDLELDVDNAIKWVALFYKPLCSLDSKGKAPNIVTSICKESTAVKRAASVSIVC